MTLGIFEKVVVADGALAPAADMSLLPAYHEEGELYLGVAAAAQAGLAEAKILAIAANKKPEGLDADEQLVYTFCTELLNTKHVSDATFVGLPTTKVFRRNTQV